MYPEEGGGAPEAMPLGGGGRPRLMRNLEGLIPLILIIIIAAFLGHRFGLWQIPFLSTGEPMRMLVIGTPSMGLQVILDQDKDLTYYRVQNAGYFVGNPADTLAQYNVILLDQHMGATAYDKAVSRTLGEAIENYVKKGGKLITVMDSGIYRSGGMYGTGIASDVVGWEATFGDIIPVECGKTANNMPTCSMALRVVGRIQRQDFDHPIMEGIEVAPADPRYGSLALDTFDVIPTGNVIAYIKSENSPANYPAIVEKKLLIGKSIYFNYDPALTPTIFESTMEYVR